jgi:hypothetical protein
VGSDGGAEHWLEVLEHVRRGDAVEALIAGRREMRDAGEHFQASQDRVARSRSGSMPCQLSAVAAA